MVERFAGPAGRWAFAACTRAVRGRDMLEPGRAALFHRRLSDGEEPQCAIVGCVAAARFQQAGVDAVGVFRDARGVVADADLQPPRTWADGDFDRANVRLLAGVAATWAGVLVVDCSVADCAAVG